MDVAGSGVVDDYLDIGKLMQFAERYPSVGIDLREGVQASVLEEVRNGSADFGLGDETDIGGPLVSEHLDTHGFSVVLPKGHRLFCRKSLTLADIAGERLVAMPTEAAARRTLDAVSLAAGVSLDSHLTVGQFTTAFELVSEGLGVAVVPSIFFARPHPADISSRPLDAPGAVQRLGIITRRDRVLSPAASAFLDVLRECWPSADG
jgi:DNA-binding transcriptional LysR family regulator